MSGIFSTISDVKRNGEIYPGYLLIPFPLISRKHDLLNSPESTATFPTNSSPCQGINCHCQFSQGESEWKLPAKVTPLSYKSDRGRVLNISRGNFSFPFSTYLSTDASTFSKVKNHLERAPLSFEIFNSHLSSVRLLD